MSNGIKSVKYILDHKFVVGKTGQMCNMFSIIIHWQRGIEDWEEMEGCGTGSLNMLTNCRNKTINELDIWQGWSEKKVLNFNGLKLESFGSSRQRKQVKNGPQMVRSMIPLRNWKEINLAGAKQTWRDELTAQKVSKASLHLYPDTARSFLMHNPLPHCQQGARWRGSREQLVRAIRSILKDIRVWIPALWP